jgi:hypothetical protein
MTAPRRRQIPENDDYHSHDRLPTNGTEILFRAIPIALPPKIQGPIFAGSDARRAQSKGNTMNPAVSAALAVSIVLGSAAVASADPITVISDGRIASVGPLLFDTSSTPTSKATAGDRLVATVTRPPTSPGTMTATLSSSFADPMHWSGTGMANMSWVAPADFGAGALFITDFLVTSPVSYAFNTSLAASSASGFNTSTAQASAHLMVFTGVLDEDREEIFAPVFGVFTREVVANDHDAANRTLTGVLLPGKYLLDVDARTTGVGIPPSRATQGAAAANFVFAFDFAPADSSPSPTPEPASLLLLATGIAGLFGVRSRRANSAA